MALLVPKDLKKSSLYSTALDNFGPASNSLFYGGGWEDAIPDGFKNGKWVHFQMGFRPGDSI